MPAFRLRAAAVLIAVGIPLASYAAGAGVTVDQAWARQSARVGGNGAAYVTLTGGDQPDALVSVDTPVAKTAEVHQSFEESGIAKMRAVPSLPISPHQVVTFEPGGYHVMLMGLKQPLAPNQTFPLTLKFAHSAPVTVDVAVQAMGRGAAPGGHDHMR